MMPQISIIIPVYNVARYLPQCLDSVIAQTMREIEIICVNDCSTDDSLAILEGYAAKDARFKVISKPENSGLSATRNVGIDNASGQYLMFIDSDDYIDVTLCKKVYDLVEEQQADLVIYDYHVFVDGSPVSANSKVEKSQLAEMDSQNRLALLRLKSFSWTKFVRSDIMRGLGIRFPEGRVYEDIPVYWQLVIQVPRISLLPEKLYYYRQRSGSICYTPNWSQADSLANYDMLREFLIKKGLISIYGEHLMERELDSLANLYDMLGTSYRDRVLDEISRRLTAQHWDYINSDKPLRRRTRDFFKSMRGSPTAKFRRTVWLAARKIYRALQ